MPAQKREVEDTYEIASSDVGAVLDRLNALAEEPLSVRSRPILCTRVRGRARTYLYLRPDDELPADVVERTQRLIFQYGKREITGHLSEKCWMRVGSGLAKYHCGDSPTMGLSELLDLLRDRPFVMAALVKCQRRYTLEDAEGPVARLALDAMIPFHPLEPTTPLESFFHLEVEMMGDETPAGFVEALRPLDHGLEQMRPIGQSKKAQAGELVTNDSPLRMGSTRELRGYLVDAYEGARCRLGPLFTRLVDR